MLIGMPGIGKSTVLDLLGKQSAELGLLCQPVREKRDYIVGGQPMDLLDNFYQSPTRDNFMSLQVGQNNKSHNCRI
jgi:nucleoside-triphosphatase THEP1